MYKCIREKYQQQAMYTNPCIEKLYSLFCSKSTTVIRNLACYLHEAFKIRKDFLNIYSWTNVLLFIPVYTIIIICLFNMYMYVIVCIYVYGPVAVNTINELNWIELNQQGLWHYHCILVKMFWISCFCRVYSVAVTLQTCWA